MRRPRVAVSRGLSHDFHHGRGRQEVVGHLFFPLRPAHASETEVRSADFAHGSFRRGSRADVGFGGHRTVSGRIRSEALRVRHPASGIRLERRTIVRDVRRPPAAAILKFSFKTLAGIGRIGFEAHRTFQGAPCVRHCRAVRHRDGTRREFVLPREICASCVGRLRTPVGALYHSADACGIGRFAGFVRNGAACRLKSSAGGIGRD